MSRLLAQLSHAHVITRCAIRSLLHAQTTVYIRVFCVRVSAGRWIPFNLRRLSTRSRVITRNSVRLKLASVKPGVRASETWAVRHYQRTPPLSWISCASLRKTRSPRLSECSRQRGIRVNVEFAPSCTHPCLPFYYIFPFLRDDRKQKLYIEPVVAPIHDWGNNFFTTCMFFLLRLCAIVRINVRRCENVISPARWFLQWTYKIKR